MSMIGSDKFKMLPLRWYNHPRHESISVQALNLNAAKIIFDLIDAGKLVTEYSERSEIKQNRPYRSKYQRKGNTNHEYTI